MFQMPRAKPLVDWNAVPNMTSALTITNVHLPHGSPMQGQMNVENVTLTQQHALLSAAKAHMMIRRSRIIIVQYSIDLFLSQVTLRTWRAR